MELDINFDIYPIEKNAIYRVLILQLTTTETTSVNITDNY